MAAYESWAGGKVGGGPDATSWSTKPRGGYVPLADIPNAPKTVEMPLAKYQAIPSIRHDYVKSDIDMESRAQKLMQKPLPGSFEEAGNIRTEAAGKGQMAWGKAIGSAGEDISKALGSFSNTMARLHGEAVKSQDETDVFRYNDLENNLQKQIDAIPTTLPPDQWQAKADELKKEFAKSAAGLGRSPSTKDRIGARTASMLGTGDMPGWVDNHLQIKGDQMSLERDRDFHTNSIQSNRQKGDTSENARHISWMKEKGYWNEETAEFETQKDRDIDSLGNFNVAQQQNPRGAMTEAEKVMNGEKSEDFPHLNKNNAATAFVQARAATNTAEQKAFNDVSNQIAAGNLINEEQIKNEARVRGLPEKDVQSLADSFTTYRGKAMKDRDNNMRLDPAAFVEAKAMVANYDEAADPTGEIFKRNVNFINGNIPPAQRSMLLEKLNSKTTESISKKKPEQLARDREADTITKEIKDLGEKGLQFADEDKRELFRTAAKKIKEGKEDLTQEELAVWREGNQWIDDKLNEVDTARAKEPDFVPGDLKQKVREKLGPELQNSIGSGPDPAVPPRATLNTGALAPTKEQLAAAPSIPRSVWTATGPREVNKPSVAFQQAIGAAGGGPSFQVQRVTAYTPGKNDIKMEGPNAVSNRKGPAFTMEGYQRGTFPYVSAAVDQGGPLAGKYFVSEAFPNVVFKGEDTGSAFKGVGTNAFDVAYEDDQKATNFEVLNTSVKVIGETDVLAITGSMRRDAGTYAGGVQPQLMSRIDALRARFPNLGEVKSGFRDPGHNKRVGGAGDSEHTRGDAVDLDASNMNIGERIRLIQQASLLGIKGIGVYENSLHFDLGEKHGPRAWGPSHRRASLPSWAEGIIREHERRYGVG